MERIKTTLFAALLLLSPCLSSVSFAEQQAFQKFIHKAPGKDHIYTLSQQDGRWAVSLFVVPQGKLQDHRWTRDFSKYSEALRYFYHLRKNAPPFLYKIQAQEPAPYVSTEAKGEVVWKTENQWSWDWEKDYGQWLKEHFHEGFYEDHQIRIDCADNPLAIRWIYSRVRKLPAGNQLAGSGVIFSNESMKQKWTKLPTHKDWHQDKRFLAALDYILDNSYTHTLLQDAYPIAINSDAFLGGTITVRLQDWTGHAQVISEVNQTDNTRPPIYILESTSPRNVQKLFSSSFSWSKMKKKKGRDLKIPLAR